MNTGHGSLRISIKRIVVFSLLHVTSIFAFIPMFLTWPNVVACLLMHWLCAGIGISLGVHRLLSHRAFRCSRAFEYLLAWLASLNWQGGPIWWAAIHQLHHGHADKPGDPHSPNEGFGWAHMRWLFYEDAALIGLERYGRFAKPLIRDPVFIWIERLRYASQLVPAVILWLIGGWGMVLWGVCVRLVLSYHATWFVNSACHTWGYKFFESGDRARNLWWVSLIAFGEGWHNNHHAHPRSAKLGMRWWEFDPMWPIILMLGQLRIVSDVRVISKNGETQLLFPTRGHL